MLKVTRLFVLGLLIIFAATTITSADDGKISGYFFGDFYHILSSHNEDLEGRNGFQHRRIYFKYDRKIEDNLAIRLLFEMNGDPVTAESPGKISPWVKNGYLSWKNPDWKTEVLFGLSATPSIANTYKLWGYRVLSKAPHDLHKYVGSTDLGLAIKGSFADKLINYHAMVGNGSGSKAEKDKEKRAYLAVALKPIKGLLIEGLADVETGDDLSILVHGLIGYQSDQFKGGAVFLMSSKGEASRKTASIFGSAKLIDNLKVIARFDKNLDLNPKGSGVGYTPYSKEANVNTIIFGLDWSPAKNVFVIPNVVAFFYDEPEKGEKPNLDLQPRLTLYYKF